MGKIILLSETGADIPSELARQHGIQLVPMHVAFGGVTRDDGAFPSDEICAYYERTKTLPKTSASTPEDFRIAFDRIHTQWPEAHILYLAYSAVTTCTYQSAQMCFIPDQLEYLRAGGRVSNAAALCGKLLNIRPLIEFRNGYLVAAKKLRGKLNTIAPQLVRDYAERHHLERDELWLIWSPGFPEELRLPVEQSARSCGFQKISWVKTGGVITTHSGPGAFGVVGFSAKKEKNM